MDTLQETAENVQEHADTFSKSAVGTKKKQFVELVKAKALYAILILIILVLVIWLGAIYLSIYVFVNVCQNWNSS